MIPSRWNRRVGTTRRSLTFARAAGLAIGVFAASACVPFVAGCGRQPSPTAPDVNPGLSSSLPAGQTHIRGLVSDTVRRPLPGALIVVLDGPLAGATQLTDAEGKFELTGTAAGTATLRVSRDGFQTKTQSVLWRTPHQRCWGRWLHPAGYARAADRPRPRRLHADHRDRPRDRGRPSRDPEGPVRGVPCQSRVVHLSGADSGGEFRPLRARR